MYFEISLKAHMISSYILLGVILLIQFVHYPSFHYVAKKDFTAFSNFHRKSISFIVVPTMLIEIISAGLLVLLKPNYQILILAALTLGTWISTFLLSVPLHMKLSLEKDKDTIRSLVRTTQPRFIMWMIKAILITIWF